MKKYAFFLLTAGSVFANENTLWDIRKAWKLISDLT